MFFVMENKYFTVTRLITQNVVKSLEEICKTLLNDQMKLNTDKFRLFLYNRGPSTMKIGNLCIKTSSCEKLFKINFDYKLNFEKHMENICQKASRKVNALARLLPYIGVTKQRTLTHFSPMSHFYIP